MTRELWSIFLLVTICCIREHVNIERCWEVLDYRGFAVHVQCFVVKYVFRYVYNNIIVHICMYFPHVYNTVPVLFRL